MTQAALRRYLSKNGRKGGVARAKRLTRARRIEIARLAGIASGIVRKLKESK